MFDGDEPHHSRAEEEAEAVWRSGAGERDAGDPTALEGDPTRAAGAVAAWIANEPRTADPSRTWRLVAALPEAVLAEPRLLRTALLIAAAATDAEAGHLRTLAVRVAAADPEFAGSLGDVAHAFAQEGQFAQALALFDVVMALPVLSTYVAKAKQHGFPNMSGIAADPLFASLRAHPRWADAFAGRL